MNFRTKVSHGKRSIKLCSQQNSWGTLALLTLRGSRLCRRSEPQAANRKVIGGWEVIMRHLKYLALLVVFVALAAAPSQAQVSIRVNIGPDYGYYHVPPVCPYGYYPDYPFGCAPYGYWAPEYFVDGVFIGAGPWYRFYYLHPVLYRHWYGPGYVYYPRHRYVHRFRDHDWDDDDQGDRHHDNGWHGRKHHHHHDDDHD